MTEVRPSEDDAPSLSTTEQSSIEKLLEPFTVRHQAHHRPIALVTSGGTAAELEVNAVRFLDNFSTGSRGARSVEQFLQRGYAVIHLWREGSASPYARVLGDLLGSKQPNHGLGFESLGKLFDGQGDEDDDEDDLVSKIRSEDPWLTKTTTSKDDAETKGPSTRSPKDLDESDGMNLRSRIRDSSQLRRALRERQKVVMEGLLLTIPFRTVDDYLAKLRLCSESLKDSQSLAIIYLAAAVSDFYIPKSQRSLHKIQSRAYNTTGKKDDESTTTPLVINDDTITLKLYPVPKLISTLRTDWAPNSFVVSFKLETDQSILREKAELAIKKYSVHLVIGNILQTRNQCVWMIQKKSDPKEETFEMTKVSKENTVGTSEELEDAIVSSVIERHFEFISNFTQTSGKLDLSVAMSSGAELVARHNRQIEEKKKRIKRELFWTRVRDISLSVGGYLIGMAITHTLSTFLTKRLTRPLNGR